MIDGSTVHGCGPRGVDGVRELRRVVVVGLGECLLCVVVGCELRVVCGVRYGAVGMCPTGVCLLGGVFSCRVVRPQSGVTALMLAADSGHPEVSELLLDRGADLEAKLDV